MNKKHHTALVGTAAALIGLSTSASAQQINVTVDGDVVAFGAQPPVEQFGSVLVPLRGVFEKLGATVAYDGGTRSILAVRGPTTVTLKLGSRNAQVNDTPRTLSVPAQAVNGTTLVPLRFVSEALGAQVRWQADSRTVIVTSSGGSTGSPPPRPNRPDPFLPGGTAWDDRYTYSRITFEWDWNGIRVRDPEALETEIRQDLNADTGSRFIGRRRGSPGTLDVNVTFKRVNSTTVRADVRLGLNQNGSGGSAVTATESATTTARGGNVNNQVVLQAFRKARREFATKVNQFARDNRRDNR